jgi:hypothetical protein
LLTPPESAQDTVLNGKTLFVKKGKTNLEKNFRSMPMDGDKEIDVGLDHRTLISVKNSSGETVLLLCVVGARGTRQDFALLDLSPGIGNAIDVYYNVPKSDVWLRSLPVSEYDAEANKLTDAQFIAMPPVCARISPKRAEG